MLVFLTKTKDQAFRDKVVPALKRIRKGIKYKKVSFDGELYSPEKGEVCLAMGEAVVKAFQDQGLLPKNKSLPRFREQPIKSPDGGYWLITHDPGALYADITKEPDFNWDIVLADRLDRTGSTDPILGDYCYVDDFSETIKYIKRKFERTCKKVTVAFDTETMGLFPQYKDKKIVCLQLTVKKGQADVCYVLGLKGERLKKIKKQIKWILNSEMVNLVGANLKYDLVWVREKWGLTCSNFYFDTLLAGGLLNENQSNSLETHTKQMLPDLGGYDAKLNTKYDKGHMEDIPKEDLLDYSGGDTDACRQISFIQRKQLKGSGLQNLYFKIIHPAARVFEDIEHNGVLVDRNRYTEVRAEIQAKADECEQKLIDMLPRKLKLKHADKAKLLTPAIIAEFMFTPYGLNLKPKQYTPKTKDKPINERKPSTSRDHFEMFDDPEVKEFVEQYKLLGQCQKAISTYVDGFLEDLRPDGRYHATHLLYKGSMYGDDVQGGTGTGRISVKNPGLQLIPKHVHKNQWAKHLRSCFVAPPGYKMVGCDYSQGELRIMACVSGDDAMLDAYHRGIDLHALTGADIAGYTLNQVLALETEDLALFDKIRLGAKAANFGKIFGQQAPSYVNYARQNYGVILTLQESEEIHEKFFKKYPRIASYHNRTINMVHRDKCVVSVLGRVRHLPMIDSPIWKVKTKAERQAINSQIQSVLSDMCLYAIALIRKRFDWDDVQIMTMIHDQILFYIKEEKINDILPEIKFIMENLPLEKEFGWRPEIPFPVDAEMGDNLAALKKIKL